MMEYDNYEQYLIHQGSKLNDHLRYIRGVDSKYQKIVHDRYKILFEFDEKSILCLGARLGGEVRAFKQLNALAIGIDINPGENNKDVLYGDFHELNFPDNIFDFVFCNSIDHSLHFDRLLKESHRVLKNAGVFLVELAIQKADEYEVIDTIDIEPIKKEMSEYYTIDKEFKIDNGWQGVLLILQK